MPTTRECALADAKIRSKKDVDAAEKKIGGSRVTPANCTLERCSIGPGGGRVVRDLSEAQGDGGAQGSAKASSTHSSGGQACLLAGVSEIQLVCFRFAQWQQGV